MAQVHKDAALGDLMAALDPPAKTIDPADAAREACLPVWQRQHTVDRPADPVPEIIRPPASGLPLTNDACIEYLICNTPGGLAGYQVQVQLYIITSERQAAISRLLSAGKIRDSGRTAWDGERDCPIWTAPFPKESS